MSVRGCRGDYSDGVAFVATPVERSDPMAYSRHSAECPDVAPDVAHRMVRYGIIRVPVDYFHLRESLRRSRRTFWHEAVQPIRRDWCWDFEVPLSLSQQT